MKSRLMVLTSGMNILARKMVLTYIPQNLILVIVVMQIIIIIKTIMLLMMTMTMVVITKVEMEIPVSSHPVVILRINAMMTTAMSNQCSPNHT
jgi:hypothetical protein